MVVFINQKVVSVAVVQLVQKLSRRVTTVRLLSSVDHHHLRSVVLVFTAARHQRSVLARRRTNVPQAINNFELFYLLHILINLTIILHRLYYFNYYVV